MSDIAVSIGDLKSRVTFQQPTLAVDPGGAQSPGWANIDSTPTVWARWVYDHGQEQIVSGADVSVQRATVTIRYRSDVLATWRLLLDNNPWMILSVDHVQDRNHWTVLRVERAKGTV